MSPKIDKHNPCADKVLGLIFLISYLSMIAIFFLGKVFDSFHKPFWTDEIYGLSTIRSSSYAHLLFYGAPGQASPAPLDYLVCKMLDQVKEKVAYFGFTPEIYFRLFANGITAASAIGILFAFKREIADDRGNIAVKAARLFLLLCLPIAYLFRTQIYYFAAETRPYALWTSLFIITLAASLSEEENKKFFFFSMMLLAFSATAAIFQLIAIAAAYFMIQLINKDTIKNIFWKEIKLFAIPLFIVLYYCLLSKNANMVSAGRTWEDFIRLWKHKLVIIPIMLSAITVCFLKKENKKYAIAPLAFLILFLMGPLIFLITRLRSFFYAERQFIYYELAVAVLILTLIKCISAYVKNIRSKSMVSVILIIFCLVGASFSFRPKFVKKFYRAEANAIRVLFNSPDFRSSSRGKGP